MRRPTAISHHRRKMKCHSPEKGLETAPLLRIVPAITTPHPPLVVRVPPRALPLLLLRLVAPHVVAVVAVARVDPAICVTVITDLVVLVVPLLHTPWQRVGDERLGARVEVGVGGNQ